MVYYNNPFFKYFNIYTVYFIFFYYFENIFFGSTKTSKVILLKLIFSLENTTDVSDKINKSMSEKVFDFVKLPNSSIFDSVK